MESKVVFFFVARFTTISKKHLDLLSKKPWKKVCKLLVPGIILKNVRESHPPFFWDHEVPAGHLVGEQPDP